jgi:hypothetical protein
MSLLNVISPEPGVAAGAVSVVNKAAVNKAANRYFGITRAVLIMTHAQTRLQRNAFLTAGNSQGCFSPGFAPNMWPPRTSLLFSWQMYS